MIHTTEDSKNSQDSAFTTDAKDSKNFTDSTFSTSPTSTSTPAIAVSTSSASATTNSTSTADIRADVIIIGAGAAGLMCAIEAAKRGRKTIVLDHANKVGKKILMSGGGRCNFTNYHIHHDRYISNNPHFCKSALSRYTQWDFINLVKKYKIPFHEKTAGQLFCDNKSSDIVNMLLSECKKYNVEIKLNTEVKIESILKKYYVADNHEDHDKENYHKGIEAYHKGIEANHHKENYPSKKQEHYFQIKSSGFDFKCESLVIASGGLSIPTMGASAFGYKVAAQFGLQVWPTRAGLVPFTLHNKDKEKFAALSGVAVDSIVSTKQKEFRENILFTHRGLSGPAILQISSYWQVGEEIKINLLPDVNVFEYLQLAQKQKLQKQIKSILHDFLPRRVVEILLGSDLLDRSTKHAAKSSAKSLIKSSLSSASTYVASVSSTSKKTVNKKAVSKKTLQDISVQETSMRQMEDVAKKIHQFTLQPNGTEGYRTAEVTLGGVDCNNISSKTMEVTDVAGLYFIGEVLDVSGWLGGYNFQWAWSSGWAAGQVV